MSIHDQPPDPSLRENQFNNAVVQGTNEALSEIELQFGHLSREKDAMPFHNRLHSEMVIDRTNRILRAIKDADPALLTERDIDLGKLAAAYHDIVQGWEENRLPGPEGTTKVMRRRFSGQNEERSAERLAAFMDQTNRNSPTGPVFSEADKEMIKQAILGTVPGFDIKKKTVTQPYLNEHSHPVARALGLADLGSAGMDGPEAFLRDGDALFREENLDILDALKNPGNITKAQKTFFRERMIAWSRGQISFAEGRKELLEGELLSISKGARDIVRGLFDKFDSSIEAAKRMAYKRESMSFEDLAADMEYKGESQNRSG